MEHGDKGPGIIANSPIDFEQKTWARTVRSRLKNQRVWYATWSQKDTKKFFTNEIMLGKTELRGILKE